MPSKLHPPKYYCDLSGLCLDHVLKFIKTGELRATNVASKDAKRSRWLISEDDWNSFLAGRSTREPDSIVVDGPTRKQPFRYV